MGYVLVEVVAVCVCHSFPGAVASGQWDSPAVRIRFPPSPPSEIPDPMDATPRVTTLRVAIALLAVYLVWGSTFVAILFAIDTIPPLTMAGIRFVVAGAVVYGLTRVGGQPPASRSHWVSACIVGFLLLSLGNGGVTWAEQHVPSGTAALVLAGIPAWMVLFDWLRPGGRIPLRQETLGLSLGLAGIALLVAGPDGMGLGAVDPVGAVVLIGASIAWSFGSIVSRSLPVPTSAFQLTGMQMLAGGAFLLVGGMLGGEWSAVDLEKVSRSSFLALGYLIVFGSLVGYSAYVWLLRSTAPAVASSYAFVNPAIAVGLGWLLAGEEVGPSIMAAMVMIVLGVALIVLRPRPTLPPPPPVAGRVAYPGGVAVAGRKSGWNGWWKQFTRSRRDR